MDVEGKQGAEGQETGPGNTLGPSQPFALLPSQTHTHATPGSILNTDLGLLPAASSGSITQEVA